MTAILDLICDGLTGWPRRLYLAGILVAIAAVAAAVAARNVPVCM